MPVIGYGEDGLTYWALAARLQDILAKLCDATPPARCTIFFRPSFGRAGGPLSAQFGEFDAILATDRAVYLIESKWDNVADVHGPLVLQEVQVLRHRIFTWLLEKWRSRDSGDQPWDDFRHKNRAEFVKAFPNRPLAPPDKLLARNLSHILNRLCRSAPEGFQVRDVLFYFHRPNVAPPTKVLDAIGKMLNSFTLVPLEYSALGQSGYFSMAP